MGKLKIVWTNQAKATLKEIYNYYKPKSLQGAKNVVNDLVNAPKSLHFAKQYQVDEINPNYRIILVRNYKLLYKQNANTIHILDIVSTQQSPSILKAK